MNIFAHLFCICCTISHTYGSVLDRDCLQREEQRSRCDNSTAANCDDNDPICYALNDERTFPDTFFTTKLTPVIAGFSGGMSALSSLIVMLIIGSSSFGLTTIPHRLVFVMSVADFFNSIAMGASTLLMPKDMVYDFQGTRLGNEFTCSLQGFIIAFFGFASLWYSAFISVYFMCSINYKMKDAKIRKCIEPFMHTSCLAMTLPTAIVFWIEKLINPTPYEPYCIVISYPYYCKAELEDSEKCTIRGTPSSFMIANRVILQTYYYFVLLTPATIIMFCMISIIVSACRESRAIISQRDHTTAVLARMNLSENTASIAKKNQEKREIEHRYTKAMVAQALAYVVAGIIPVIGFRLKGAAYTAVRPCHGLLNFLVFFNQKIFNARQIDPTLTRIGAALRVLTTKETLHFQISGISLLEQIKPSEFRLGNDRSNLENNEANNITSMNTNVSFPGQVKRQGGSWSSNLKNNETNNFTTMNIITSFSGQDELHDDNDAKVFPSAFADEFDEDGAGKQASFSNFSSSSLQTPSNEPGMGFNSAGSNVTYSEDGVEGRAERYIS
jgi:hypothetical protein